MSQAGVINIEAANPQIPTKFTTDAGVAIPIGNELEILGLNGLTTAGAGKTVTILGINATAGATALLATKGVASFDSSSFTVTNGFVELNARGISGIVTDEGLPAIEPDFFGNVNLISGNGISITGQGPGSTGTISAKEATVLIEGISRLATDAEAISGGIFTNVVIIPSSLKAKLGSQTSHGIAYGAGTNSAIAWTPALANGELVIGRTGNTPLTANLTSTGGTVVITNGAGSINLEASAAVPIQFTAEDTTIAVPVLGNLNVYGTATNGIQTTAVGSTMYIGMASPYSDGDFTFSTATAGATRTLTISNTDNSNVASHAHVAISTGGSNSGDPYTSFSISGAGIYSIGIDNSVAGDPFKITGSASPSGGTDLITMTSAGVITLANDLDVTEGGTGVSTLTSHGILMGNGSGDINATAEPSDGQLLIGKTGNFPVLATLASAGGSITITNGAGSIDLAVTNPMLPWTAITDASFDIAVNNGYKTNRGTLVTGTLPASAALHSIVRIVNVGAGGVKIAQRASQTIRRGANSSTTGAGGYIQSIYQYSSVELLCTVADTDFQVISGDGGNWTFV